MQTMFIYISILRGINVSGKNLMKMDVLRSMYENLKFKNVRTYVQSGNVVFSSVEENPEQLETLITEAIEKEFGYKVPVLVLNEPTFSTIIANNPFIKDKLKDPSFLHVTFLANQPLKNNIDSIREKKHPDEAIEITDNAVYLYCPKGYGKTNLHNNFLENKLKVKATTRNWKTVNEIQKLARQ